MKISWRRLKRYQSQSQESWSFVDASSWSRAIWGWRRSAIVGKKGCEWDEQEKATQRSCCMRLEWISGRGRKERRGGTGRCSGGEWAVVGRGTIRYRPFNLLVNSNLKIWHTSSQKPGNSSFAPSLKNFQEARSKMKGIMGNISSIQRWYGYWIIFWMNTSAVIRWFNIWKIRVESEQAKNLPKTS